MLPLCQHIFLDFTCYQTEVSLLLQSELKLEPQANYKSYATMNKLI